jgi:hypothetical protein
VSVSVAAFATDVYKWVDENGKTQYGSSVPERYKGSAKKVGEGSAPSAAQREEAAARLAREKAAAEQMAAQRAKPNPVSTIPAPDAKPIAADDCEAQKKRYRESMNCFAPYVTVNGTVKAEAYQHCVEMRQPTC